MMNKAKLKQVLNGIILVDKPPGLTSNKLLQQVKQLFNVKKAGHTGSLDPLATGMLPICFGEATKFCQYLLDADKDYEATGLLGIKTNTGDACGEIIEIAPSFNLMKIELENALNQFRGSIKQIPSMFSALKHKGTPLYKYAREGTTIAREPRNIMIYQLDLQSFDGERFDIKVSCSKGTYIRSLIEDIGEYLGLGAHVTRLRRIYTAGFEKEKMYTLSELKNKSEMELLECLLPMERAVNYLPVCQLTTDETIALRQGKLINKLTNQLHGSVRLHDEASQFVGLGEFDDTGRLSAKRLLAVRMKCSAKTL